MLVRIITAYSSHQGEKGWFGGSNGTCLAVVTGVGLCVLHLDLRIVLVHQLLEYKPHLLTFKPNPGWVQVERVAGWILLFSSPSRSINHPSARFAGPAVPVLAASSTSQSRALDVREQFWNLLIGATSTLIEPVLCETVTAVA